MIGQPPKSGNSLLKTIFPQLVLLTLVGVLYGLSLLKIIPSPSELNEILVNLFKNYGIPIIALSSFLENLIGINGYFPGAFTILTGMSLTAGHPAKAILTYFAIYLPAYTANIISFFAGRLKTQSEEQRLSTPRKRWTWFFATYWHPQLAAITAFSAGLHGEISKRNFLLMSLVASGCWSMLWAVTIYHFGLMASVADYFAPLFIAYLLVWIATDVWKFSRTPNRI